jgi:hypothetical protein
VAGAKGKNKKSSEKSTNAARPRGCKAFLPLPLALAHFADPPFVPALALP